VTKMIYTTEKIAEVGESLRRRQHRMVGERLGLLAWGKKYLPHYLKLPPSSMHSKLASKLDRIKPGESLVLEGPRGSAKSVLLGLLMPLRRICERREKFIMMGAETVTQAEAYLAHIKEELENNEDIAEDYPEVHGVGDVWATTKIVTRNGVRVEVYGTLSSIRGKRKNEDRPSLITMDDPEGDLAEYSPTRREHVYTWFHKAVMNMGNKETITVVCGTRIHRECLTAKLAEEPGWQSWTFKSICEFPERMDLWEQWEFLYASIEDEDKRDAELFYKNNQKEMNLGARVLWPEHESLLELMKKRASIGHTPFEAEHQNNPIAAGQMEWAPELLEGDDIVCDKWPNQPEFVAIGCDPSKGVKKERNKGRGDFTAIITLALKDNLIYVDASIQRRDATALAGHLFLEFKRRQPNIFAIETNQFQELIANELERIARVQGSMPIPVMRVENQEPKDFRIRRLGAYLNVRAFRFMIKNPDVRVLLQQLRDFPNGKYDDGPDAFEMALRALVLITNEPSAEEIAQTAQLPYME